MRRLISTIAVLVLLGSAATAVAQESDDTESKLYEFDEKKLKAGTVGPDGKTIDVRGESEFVDLHSLDKKDFLEKTRQQYVE